MLALGLAGCGQAAHGGPHPEPPSLLPTGGRDGGTDADGIGVSGAGGTSGGTGGSGGLAGASDAGHVPGDDSDAGCLEDEDAGALR